MKNLLIAATLASALGTAVAQEMTVTRNNTFGCIDYAYYDHLLKLAAAKDKQGFSQGLMQGALKEQCALFQSGDRVHRIDSKLSGQSQVRRAQDKKLYWIASDVLR